VRALTSNSDGLDNSNETPVLDFRIFTSGVFFPSNSSQSSMVDAKVYVNDVVYLSNSRPQGSLLSL
jgi:tRNA (Thr-GGU) A37 N-methylase